jgi:hypothetical protein
MQEKPVKLCEIPECPNKKKPGYAYCPKHLDEYRQQSANGLDTYDGPDEAQEWEDFDPDA